MAQIKDISPSFYPPYVILNKFMQSIENNTYNTLKELAISQNWNVERIHNEFRKHEILKSADKLGHIYPLEEKRVRNQKRYYKNRRSNKYYRDEENDESSGSKEDSQEEGEIKEQKNFAQPKQNTSEEFLFPSNVYSWLIHKATDQFKKYKDHIKLNEVSIVRKMKKELIQEFKKKNPMKDVRKLLIVRYNRYQVGYYNSKDTTDRELSADSSQKSR